ncbi:MAG TPA: hypothetical protein VKD22_14050 [Ramlibacter sp.]|nr:hypothetical protein [Ramlibacter sp.]
MAIHFSLRLLTVPSVALAAVLAAGCQSTLTSRADHSTSMGAAAVHGSSGPGTTAPSGTTGPSNSTGTTGATTR